MTTVNTFDAQVAERKARERHQFHRERDRIWERWPGNSEIDKSNREIDLSILFGRRHAPAPYEATPEFFRWLARTDEHVTRLPYDVEKSMVQAKRKADAEFYGKISNQSSRREQFMDEVEEVLPDWSQRRRMEHDLAHKMLELCDGWKYNDIRKAAEKMLLCRCGGMLGDGPKGRVVAWDSKCSCSRFCPDESRHETKRLSDRYIPHMLFWKARHKKRRLQYAVMTSPNAALGQLMPEKVALMKRFDAWRKKHPAIKGDLVVQEDPLSARGNWNVHINVILMVEGDFDWKVAQASWGHGIKFNGIDATADALGATMRELMKYSATIALTKSHDKAEAGKTQAPPLLEWPEDAFLEWVQAQLGEYGNSRRAPFRRVRSHGCLYNLNAMRWHESNTDEQCRLSALAGVDVGYALEGTRWLKLPKEAREALKPLLSAEERKEDPFEGVTWVAPLRFDGAAYRVFSIPGDNFYPESDKSTANLHQLQRGPPI